MQRLDTSLGGQEWHPGGFSPKGRDRPVRQGHIGLALDPFHDDILEHKIHILRDTGDTPPAIPGPLFFQRLGATDDPL